MGLVHCGRALSMTVNEHGELDVVPSASGRNELSLSPSLRNSEPSCGEPALGRSKTVPVLVSFAELAPLVDPALWPEFTSIEMADQVVLGPCSLGDGGWHGTIVETLSMDLLGATTVVRNRLDIDFCILASSSRAIFGLNQCLEGGIIHDSGFVEGRPAALGFSELRAEKALNWAPGSMPCFFPRAVNELILSTALTLGLIEYAVRVVERVAEKEGSGLLVELKEKLRELGFDHAAGRLLPHFHRT